MLTKRTAFQFILFFVFISSQISCVRTTPVQDHLVVPQAVVEVEPVKLTEEQKRELFNVFMYQSCRENGVKVSHVPTAGLLSDYKFTAESLDSIPLKVKDNYYVLLNSDGKIGRVKSAVIKNNTAWFEAIRHTTCNHDGQPTECPDNTNTLTVSNLYPTLREIITVTWNGTLQKDQTLYRFGQGYEVLENVSETVMKIRITESFFHIQMQPTVSQYNGCHGWTAFTGNIVK